MEEHPRTVAAWAGLIDEFRKAVVELQERVGTLHDHSECTDAELRGLGDLVTSGFDKVDRRISYLAGSVARLEQALEQRADDRADAQRGGTIKPADYLRPRKHVEGVEL